MNLNKEQIDSFLSQSKEYQSGFKDGYSLGARPLNRAAYNTLHKDYIRGYIDGYDKASQEGDDAFQKQYSMDG